MPLSKGPLGMNARNFLYIRKYNSTLAKRIADDKLRTKRLLISHKIPTTRLIKAFNTRESVREFDWDLPQSGFVVKPARGYGGEGILVFTGWKKDRGRTISGKRYNRKQLESHIFDVFEGVYSLQDLPDKAYIEEKVTSHKFFKKLVPVGLADIRIVLLKGIPIMAMLRLPTSESKGTANLHLGAIGVGIDIRTGITQHAIRHGTEIKKIPGTNYKTRGIKIPNWDNLLTLAAKTQEVSTLGYMGIDIVFDAKKGPVVLEINSRPGLEIQKANLDSLRMRMEKVEDIKVANVERGIELAKSLFASEVVQNVNVAPTMLSVLEPTTFHGRDTEKTYEAKIDSGAFRTAVDWQVLKDLNIEPLSEKIWIDSTNGRQQRPAVKLDFTLAGKRIKTTGTVTDRKHMNYPIIIGRKDMTGFVINPTSAEEIQDEVEEDN
ncbi:hypothetical protein A3A54_01075 [Candidatus Curtissbacteria bacterium RIFCSPLOWO2_01_FULL_39_62]|uniref:ATP-grasp domain-containing protein n=1 Tax=Candidatus Curtissbacteria bacterium RIFCSPLOWO2_12_FULL_38_9 TaxID=1797735 RepID=A0A1F5ICY0_9BACT|nr:MAG: hypothetical protein A2775_01685 [Candidatus Curtissbacteria bacterium RIFCSPHIGHO2_01_FULL_39_57]OGD91043.1 MAG: hypothetical protein A3E11_00205 [Candidatus Curtissbacteria bacterium RIFCSPHIGHO2_12_FULL_38_37]OGD99377.1 MAG: hypothetical protein A3J17_02405 [Candidatus Curtissbacteria bacterium RIFCSPLOWO2_02_FULL_40_11]OGE01407.1 MAG: hypothetical protein A3A54_01075 [Candidatus Curtissbacteria bacterium RIFCSPLOWO2_01_FULL_39_62]OGE14236.1 MAG: hypothetical protein A3G14_04310 [Can